MDADTWLAKSIDERQELLSSTPLIDMRYLGIVRAPGNWGVFASAGRHYRQAIFGRDSLETAEDLCDFDQDLARTVILSMARLQGYRNNPLSEEEPGKIVHEFRSTKFGDAKITWWSRMIMWTLRSRWGRPDDGTVLYYGSYDSTLLYIRLVERYCKEYGVGILNQAYFGRTGTIRNIRNSVLLATDWLVGKLMQREDHLLEYRRLNPQGLENQVWKDSHTSYLFGDGTVPNLDAGVVSVELQGYAYDALKFAATLSEPRAEEFERLAKDLQQSTIKRLWMPEAKFFAQGLAKDHKGQERLLDTLTSDAGLLLDSRLLADLPTDTSSQYIAGLVKTLIGPEFLTDAGIRCRALKHANIPGFPDYHGTYAVWPKETFDIAEGLGYFGYQKESEMLMEALIRATRRAGEFYEFYYVDTDGTVWYDGEQAVKHFEHMAHGNHMPIPEPGQAWTISAVVASSHLLASKTSAT